jgi:hypothetical protein
MEQIKDGKNGLISKLNDEDLANCIKEIYLNPKLKIKLEKNVMQEKISFDNQMNKLDEI